MPFNPPVPDNTPRKRDNGGLGTLIQAEKMVQIAILLPSAAFIGWLAGAWLDSKLHQSWIGLAGMVFGGISGLVYVVRLVMASGGDDSGAKKNPEIEP
jgi:putative F0F1-ATPase subunit (Ca2+/Mg2+ transporter)